MQVHDAARYAKGLRLSLAQDKAPLGLLLAAGCAVAVRPGGTPLIPDIAAMTTALTTELSAGDDRASFDKLVACLAEDGVAHPNVENWLSHVRALRLVAGGGAVRGLAGVELDALETAITEGIVALADKELPDAETPFHGVAAWAGALDRDLPVEIFTPNYDLLLEQAFESMRRPYFDGFVGARAPFFDNASVSPSDQSPVPPRFTRLWKLHGSVNWYLTADGDVTRCQAAAGMRRLIHPSHLKYDETRQMPYQALFDRLRAFLGMRGALLVTCGYSFGDRHINAVLMDALQANPTASVVGLVHGTLSNYETAKNLALHQPNFGLYARDAAVIGTREGPWEADDAGAVGVTGVDTNSAGEVELLLGDFAAFGRFLAGLDRSPASF